MRFPSWRTGRQPQSPQRRRIREARRKYYHLQIVSLEDRVAPAVVATYDGTTHKLTVTADATDNVSITVAGTDVQVNGVNPDRTPAAATPAADVQTIQVTATGNFPNTINL